MPQYTVTALKTVERSYQITAETPEEAKQIWEKRADLQPSEEQPLKGEGFQQVLDENGNVVLDECPFDAD